MNDFPRFDLRHLQEPSDIDTDILIPKYSSKVARGDIRVIPIDDSQILELWVIVLRVDISNDIVEVCLAYPDEAIAADDALIFDQSVSPAGFSFSVWPQAVGTMFRDDVRSGKLVATLSEDFAELLGKISNPSQALNLVENLPAGISKGNQLVGIIPSYQNYFSKLLLELQNLGASFWQSMNNVFLDSDLVPEIANGAIDFLEILDSWSQIKILKSDLKRVHKEWANSSRKALIRGKAWNEMIKEERLIAKMPDRQTSRILTRNEQLVTTSSNGQNGERYIYELV